ncbi:MAG: PHP-associated domain-containing protein [Candidatus Eisenbacteria bacterium]
MNGEAAGGSNLVRVEIHVHTDVSDDSGNTFGDLERAASEKKIDAYAITDHDTLEGALHLRDRGRVSVIVGEEVTTSLGDVIGLFLETIVPPGLSPEETMDAIHEQGGLVYVPHPFDRKRKSRLFREAIERCVPRIDLFEVRNGRTPHESDNERAAAFAGETGLLAACGSDAHLPFELGRIFHEVPPFDSPSGFLRSIRAGRAVVPAASARSVGARLFGFLRGTG